MKPYYRIFRSGSGSSTGKIASLELAAKEADRMATETPDVAFEILKCVGITRTTTPQTFWMDGVIPPHNCYSNWPSHSKCVVCGKPLTEGGGDE